MPDPDLIVVGGGPAGMMAAGRAAERGRRVRLLERGPALGRKLLMTATGRCNVTNSAPLTEFLDAFGRQGGFLRDSLAGFGNTELLDWLHVRGIETVEERKGRVFPATQDARTILHALTGYLAQGGAEVRLNERVVRLRIEDGAVTGVETAAEAHRAPNVLIATGGLSYPATGSTGDGYELARQAGHTLVDTYPAIIGLETAEDWPQRIQGTPIKNVSIRVRQENARLTETFGEALWTHYGLSGPAVFDISRDVVLALRKAGAVTLELDLRPNDTEDALHERLLYAIKKDGKKQVDTVVSDWAPGRTATLLVELAGVDPKKKMNQCSKSDRKRIVRLIKRLDLHVRRPRPVAEAIVTGGGVALHEIDPRRMESRLCKGLFFAGEILDLAGPTGGYNLQEAFSTGRRVAESV